MAYSSIAQGVFESNTTGGNWSASGNWTLVSGTDADGVPDSNDDVTILSGDQININSNQQCDDLTIVGTLNFSRNNRTLTVNGNLSMSGTTTEVTGDGSSRTLSITGTFSVVSGAVADINGITVTVTGVTTLDGTLNFMDITGDKTFGTVDINSGGTWGNGTVAEDFTINGNLINDGTFTGCSATTGCQYELTSSSGTISGGSSYSIADINIDSPGAYTSTATIVMTDELRGTGSFTNGGGSSLELQGGGPYDISTFSASTNSNTVTYTLGTAENIFSVIYHNLVINKTADASLAGSVTVNNQLTLTNGNLVLGTNTLTMASGATISGGSSTSYIEIASSGLLRQSYTAAGSTLAFPVGDNNDYSPITAFTINSATFGAGAFLEFDVTDGNHPSRNTANLGSGGDDDGTAASDLISRYWTVTANNITSPDFSATYVYVDADVSGTEANMVATIYRTHPTLAILDWFVTGTVNPTNNSVSLTNADAFGDLYAMDNGGSRLPIVLLSFDATLADDRVIIEWTTVVEINNEIYTIERSRDGLNFEPILFKEGAGNSNGILNYAVTDYSPLSGRSYYRLKQTDFNGMFDYSEVVSVQYEPTGSSEITFKNLLQPGESALIQLKNFRVKAISLRDFNGTELPIKLLGVSNEDSVQIQIPINIIQGVYLLIFESLGERRVCKVLIQN